MREAPEEERIRRAVTIAVMVVAALLGVVLVSGGTAGTATRASSSADQLTPLVGLDSTTTTVAPVTIAPTTTTPPTKNGTATTTTSAATTTTATATDPGALPQTDARPSASGPTFTAGVDGLWEAIRQDRPELGLPFFFPKSAYLQVKAIGDPAGDYQNRLIANFEEDVHSLHAQLGAGAANATLAGVTVPDDAAVWVQPGEESNQLSYWRVYGSTIQYQLDGQTGSFPLTSLISWRGEWYVVHLGAIR
jgi:cytoskeletal protein RodZ